VRKTIKIPRILKINRIDGLSISVVFNNGDSRMIDFREVFKDMGLSRRAGIRKLSIPKEFKKVQLNNNTLSWHNAGDSVVFKGKKIRVPFEIGADVLFKYSKKDLLVSTLAIGQRLREIREQSGLTQKVLAQRSGTTPNYISRIENDRSGIELSTLQKIVVTGLGRQLEVKIR